MKKLLAIALLACVSAPAMAETSWISIGTNDAGTKFEMNGEDVVKSDHIRPIVWMRTTEKNGEVSRAKITFDCRAHTWTMDYLVTNKNGKIETSSNLGTRPVVPDSVTEDAEEFACTPLEELRRRYGNKS